MPGLRRQRAWALVVLALLFALGLASKLYAGPGAWWCGSYLGGVFYVMLWCVAAFIAWPRARPERIAAWVVAVTCVLEALQLWHPAWLEPMRRSFWGAALLGNTFSWWDFPYYFLGGALAWALMARLHRAA